MKIIFTLFISMLVLNSMVANAGNWRGLIIAPEKRCAEYDRKKDYSYPRSIEDKIIASMNSKIYAPYTGRTFINKNQTDIEHIVAISEAHDSGLCNADLQTRKKFARDLLNLTLATPKINRCKSTGKCGKDAAEWLPEKNKCWFAWRIVEVRQKYALSIDLKEAMALDKVLLTCQSTEMLILNNFNQKISEEIKISQ